MNIKNIKEWMEATTEKEQLLVINAAGTKLSYMIQLKGEHSWASARLAIKLEAATKKYTPTKLLTRKVIRPDLFS